MTAFSERYQRIANTKITPALVENVADLPVLKHLRNRGLEYPNLSAAVLALVGWTAVNDGTALHCDFCNRTLAPHNFEVAADSANPFDGSEPQEKRQKTGAEGGRSRRLDPFREHRWFCCWTKEGAMEGGRVLKPGWEICAASLAPREEDGRRERISAVNVAANVQSMLRAFKGGAA